MAEASGMADTKTLAEDVEAMKQIRNGDVAFERDVSLNIYQRIHAARAEVSGHIDKDLLHETQYKTPDGGKKKGKPFAAVSHDAVTAHIRRSVIKHGIDISPSVESYVQAGNRTEVMVNVSFINIDHPDDRSSNMVVAYGNDFSDKGPGKAMSYAVKIILLKRFLLNSADESEADNIEHETDSARLKLADAQKKIDQLDTTALNNLKQAVENATSMEAIDDLMADNKKSLREAPAVTQEFFNELAATNKRALEEE